MLYPDSFEEETPAPVFQIILDANAAPPLVAVYSVAVLEFLQSRPVSGLQDAIGSSNMNIGYVPRAVGERGHRVEERRANEVGELNSDVILAVPERGEFDHAGVVISAPLEFLGKDRVRNGGVLPLCAAVRDDDAFVVDDREPVVHHLAHGLYRRGVKSRSVYWCPDSLDNEPAGQANLIALEQIENLVEEAERMTSLVSTCGVEGRTE